MNKSWVKTKFKVSEHNNKVCKLTKQDQNKQIANFFYLINKKVTCFRSEHVIITLNKTNVFKFTPFLKFYWLFKLLNFI